MMQISGTASSDEAGYTNGNWWQPIDPLKAFSLNVGNFNSSATIASTIMRATLMKAAVVNHYKTEAEKANNGQGAENVADVDEAKDFGFYTIGVVMGQIENDAGVAVATGGEQSQVANAYAGWYFWSTEQALSGSKTVTGRDVAGNTVTISLADNGTVDIYPRGTGNNINRRTFNQFTTATVTASNGKGGTVDTTVAKNDVVNAFPYTTQYFAAGGEGEESIGNTLTNLIKEITTPTWDAVGGINAAGVQDSVTYSDPIGDYMTVDSVTDIVLFGHRYKVGAVGTYSNKSNNLGSLPSYIKSANINTSDEKIQNTTYTVYQIKQELNADGSVKTANINSSNSTRYNLSYADDKKDAYFDDLIKNGQDVSKYRFDLLEDIHIWVEDTGEWRDAGEGGFIVNSGYSEALFINISKKAMPVQIATIIMASDDESPKQSHPKEYTTNLRNTAGSTPLRVFYNVSLNKDYLRYYMAGVDRTKANATGVALSKISTEYLEKNTGYYTYDANGRHAAADSAVVAKRQVAFYSNYFTNNIYDEYPVASDNNKTSRGNPDITFAPGTDNQFYRFQKNRVLFLIPGADEKTARPAEIDLGALEDLEGLNEIYSAANNGARFTTWAEAKAAKWDPTTVEGLQKILNAARVKNKAYYSNYDCIPVTGDHNVPIGPRAGADRDPKLWWYGEGDGKFELANEISSDNWYYIIREFYCPVEFGSDGVTATKVEVRYMAIARKGNEFGSGVAYSDGQMGSEVEWYYPGEGEYGEDKLAGFNTGGKNTAEFVNDPASHYGHPTQDGKVTHGTGWYVSACQRRCDFVVFRRTGNVEKWRVNVYSL